MTDPARVVVLTVDELRAIVREEVQSAVSAARPSDDDWLDADAVAKMLSVKRDTVRSLVKRDGLPAYRTGRLYTFRRSEVERWLEERATKRGSQTGRHAATLRAVRGARER